METPIATDRTDLKPLLRLGRRLSPWRELWQHIPSASELVGEDIITVRKQALDVALAAFKRRADSGQLSRMMQYEYAGALEMAGDLAGATQQLARTAAAYPEEAARTTLVLTEIHERRADWETLYEILRGWVDRPDVPLALWLRLCRAEMHLNLGLAALEHSHRAVEAYPHSSDAIRLRAMVLRQYESPEEALFFLSRPRLRRDPETDMLEAEVLFMTQRFSELIRFVEEASLPGIDAGLLPQQSLFLPPAEQAVLWHRVSLPSDADFARTAETLRRNLKTASSPFLRALMSQWLAAYENRGGGDAVSLDRWRACGRDVREQATALNQLSLILCRRGDLAGARRAAEAAVQAWPQSATLWRIAVSLAHADLGVIGRARQACPTDPELWLAEIVARSQQKTGDVLTNSAFSGWADLEMDRVARGDCFSAGTVIRAGEYLARGGLMRAASVAARDASKRSRSLLPASVLALRCALRTKDKEWALESTRQAMRESIAPLPVLHKIMVELRGGGAEAPLDDDMVATLKHLQRTEPGNALWAEMLTYILFHRESWTEMMSCLGEAKTAIEDGSKKRMIFVMGAEAARQMNLIDQSAQILRQGLSLYTGDLALFNNLAYTLAQNPATLAEARQMIPQLVLRAKDNPQVLDTIASIWIRAGNPEEAEPWVARLERFQDADPRWRSRVCLHRADIAVLTGRPEEARRLAQLILADSHKARYEDVMAANRILHEGAAASPRPK